MSLEYYTRNLDYYGNQNRSDTPRNAVIDVLFSDTQTVSTPNGGESVLTLNAEGGEYSLQDDRLIDADIILLFRDGLNYYETEVAFTGLDKEFQFDSVTGTITYPPAPFPDLQPNEKTTVSYVAAGSAIVITEPITLAQAKAWLRVTHTDEDAIITALITAARQICEGYISKSFVERTVTAIVRNDLGNIKLPYGPVGNITYVYDVDGNEITGTEYTLTGVSDKRLGYPMSSYVKVIYTAGYSVLPQQFKTALKMQLSWMYTHRGDDDGSVIAPDSKAILNPYKSHV
jgi:uncharacterized phiE125 gp8 family phage protein